LLLIKQQEAGPKSKDVMSQALKLLSHKEPLMRYMGLGALEAMGPLPGVVEAVEKMHAAEKEENTKKRAEQVLGNLKKKP
jgi:hypothetical protein